MPDHQRPIQRHPRRGLQARLEPALVFLDSALPLSCDLAKALRGVLEPALGETPKAWPFPDRVFVWLLPEFEAEAYRFHAGKGPGLAETFKPWQLESLDQLLVGELGRRVEQIRPGTVQLLLDLAGGVDQADD